jgi:CRP-like cAMP-binding protein
MQEIVMAAEWTNTTWPAETFLGSLRDVVRRDLLTVGVDRPFAAKEPIIRQGEPHNHVVLILDGVIKVSTTTINGHHALLAVSTRGELIGEMAFLTGAPRSAHVLAATRVHAKTVAASRFAEFLNRWPDVTNQVAGMVVRRLRVANERRSEFRSCSARQRIAHVLADLAEMYGRRSGSVWMIGAEIKQDDIASLASVDRSTVEKKLREFEADGLVVRDRRQGLRIPDPQRLKTLWGDS